MAWKQPEQSPGYIGQNESALARQIKADLKRRGMTQKDLAAQSGLPEARISRILRGGNVKLTEQDINQLALGLRKTPQERDEMRYLAWPELRCIDEALKQGESVIELNWRLEKAGFPFMGMTIEND